VEELPERFLGGPTIGGMGLLWRSEHPKMTTFLVDGNGGVPFVFQVGPLLVSIDALEARHIAASGVSSILGISC